MKHLLAICVPILALSCGACAPLAFGVIGAAGTAALIEHFDPSLGVGAAEAKANAAVVNTVGPYLSKGVNVVFCNKYAQRAFDPSEAKNQPACTAGK